LRNGSVVIEYDGRDQHHGFLVHHSVLNMATTEITEIYPHKV